MNQDDLLGRNPLETGRDSIWMKPKTDPPVSPPAPPQKAATDQDISKILITDDKPAEKPSPPPQNPPPVKEGPPLVSSEKPVAQKTPVPETSRGDVAKESHANSEETDEIQDMVQLVGFKLGKEFFGIGIINVQEIIRYQEITQVPRTPKFVEGVISLRGRVIPVINLRKRFGLDSIERTKETRIIIVELDISTVGFIVDAVTEVSSIAKSTIDPAPPTAVGINKEYIQGVGKLGDKLMIILDLGKVLSSESKEQIKQMMA